MSAMPPAKTAVSASGYCANKNGTVPAKASGKSVTIEFDPAVIVFDSLTLRKFLPPGSMTTVSLFPRSVTTNSSTAVLKHSAATANLRCSTLRSASQMTARAVTIIRANDIWIRCQSNGSTSTIAKVKTGKDRIGVCKMCRQVTKLSKLAPDRRTPNSGAKRTSDEPRATASPVRGRQ